MNARACVRCGRIATKTRKIIFHKTTGELTCVPHSTAAPCDTCKTVAHTSGHCMNPKSNFWGTK